MSNIPNHKSLLRLGLEFLAIFVAVMLSFLAEDWREHLGDQRKEIKLLNSLVHDLYADTLYIKVLALPVHQLALESGMWLQTNWSSENASLDSINLALYRINNGLIYAPNRTEYESAKNSGKLEVIENESLRRKINIHYEQTHYIVRDIARLDLDASKTWREAFKPYVRFSSLYGFEPSPIDLSILPDLDWIPNAWPEVYIDDSWSNFTSDINAENSLVELNTFRILEISWYLTYLKETEDLIEAIKKDLKVLGSL